MNNYIYIMKPDHRDIVLQDLYDENLFCIMSDFYRDQKIHFIYTYIAEIWVEAKELASDFALKRHPDRMYNHWKNDIFEKTSRMYFEESDSLESVGLHQELNEAVLSCVYSMFIWHLIQEGHSFKYDCQINAFRKDNAFHDLFSNITTHVYSKYTIDRLEKDTDYLPNLPDNNQQELKRVNNQNLSTTNNETTTNEDETAELQVEKNGQMFVHKISASKIGKILSEYNLNVPLKKAQWLKILSEITGLKESSLKNHVKVQKNHD